MKEKDLFSDVKPKEPKKKQKIESPDKPEKNNSEFIPKFTFFDKIFKSAKNKKIQKFEQLYADSLNTWKNKNHQVYRRLYERMRGQSMCCCITK